LLYAPAIFLGSICTRSAPHKGQFKRERPYPKHGANEW
jgi:hypothetical protein